jgi:hypothetical protein
MSGQNFEGDSAIEFRVSGLVNLAHAALSNARKDAIMMDECSLEGGWIHAVLDSTYIENIPEFRVVGLFATDSEQWLGSISYTFNYESTQRP